ncbi:MAG: 3-oxoacyl-ACP reductase FabG [Candidatus Nanopelagicaceae bacterium]|nr:3-oxoacyl-ACP reductase FabG [Candidatus Nanopelagicaceae bacterium]
MRVALVTGGATGMGAATVAELAKEKITVALQYSTSVSEAKKIADKLKSEGGKVEIFQADLSEKDSADHLVAQVKEKLGAIDILVNNAGVMSDASIIEMSDDLWDQALNLNLTSAFKLIRATAPSMVSKKWGRIINISSQVALTGSANHAHYAAAKAGLLGLTYSAAKEYGASCVTVNAVLPGRIETNMIAQRSIGKLDGWLSQTPLNRLGKPEEVASMVSFLVSEKASYITGAAINVNGGLVMG